MIDLMFWLGPEVIIVKVNGNNISFKNVNQNTGFVSIEGLRLSKEGVVKEFPDLKDREDWKDEAIERFKDHIKSLKTEKEKVDYIAEDLKKHGYVLKQTQLAGQRWRHWKNGVS